MTNSEQSGPKETMRPAVIRLLVTAALSAQSDVCGLTDASAEELASAQYTAVQLFIDSMAAVPGSNLLPLRTGLEALIKHVDDAMLLRAVPASGGQN